MRFRAWPTRWRASETLPTAGGSCCRCRRHGIPGPTGAMTCAMRRMWGLRASRCWRGRGGSELSYDWEYIAKRARALGYDKPRVGDISRIASVLTQLDPIPFPDDTLAQVRDFLIDSLRNVKL